MQRRNFFTGVVGSLTGLVVAPASALSRVIPVTLGTHDTDLLVRTLYGEAQFEPEHGQIAICDVVFNRVAACQDKHDKHISVGHVCSNASQFSCWNRPHKLWALDRNSEDYLALLNLSQYALYLWRRGIDFSRGANHYIRRVDHVNWTHGHKPTAQWGNHLFYNVA